MRRFGSDEEGQGMSEYALVIVLIAIFMIITQVFFKDQLANFFSNIGNHLT